MRRRNPGIPGALAKTRLDEETMRLLVAKIAAHGVYGAANRLGVNPATIDTVLGRGLVKADTAARLAERLRGAA